jgi:hypothetical protein
LSFLDTQKFSTAPASGFGGVGEQHMSEAAIDGAPDGLMMPPGDDVRQPFLFAPLPCWRAARGRARVHEGRQHSAALLLIHEARLWLLRPHGAVALLPATLPLSA